MKKPLYKPQTGVVDINVNIYVNELCNNEPGDNGICGNTNCLPEGCKTNDGCKIMINATYWRWCHK
ncbi:MAG: hypothetical protein LBK00_10470 [Treponema sp.]|jgi:hypothetical protein|nr:hypothetical protein [Treponema sp.]